MEPHTDFPFDEIDAENPLADRVNDAAEEMAATALKSLVQWIAGQNQKPDGVKLRSYVAMWFLLPEFSRMTMTQLASEIGVCKQSLGRQVSAFRDAFPGLKTPTMKSETARAVYRRIVLKRNSQ